MSLRKRLRPKGNGWRSVERRGRAPFGCRRQGGRSTELSQQVSRMGQQPWTKHPPRDHGSQQGGNPQVRLLSWPGHLWFLQAGINGTRHPFLSGERRSGRNLPGTGAIFSTRAADGSIPDRKEERSAAGSLAPARGAHRMLPHVRRRRSSTGPAPSRGTSYTPAAPDSAPTPRIHGHTIGNGTQTAAWTFGCDDSSGTGSRRSRSPRPSGSSAARVENSLRFMIRCTPFPGPRFP